MDIVIWINFRFREVLFFDKINFRESVILREWTAKRNIYDKLYSDFLFQKEILDI